MHQRQPGLPMLLLLAGSPLLLSLLLPVQDSAQVRL
jgi:hypothetical protein